MAANNEIGSVNDLTAIGELCRKMKIIFHSDATQAVGRMPLEIADLGIHLLSLSGHKIYGPKGVGALIMHPQSPSFELRPQMAGGEQERRLRPGTLNVPGIVGLGMACEILKSEMATEIEKLGAWTEQVLSSIENHSGVHINGPRLKRLCNNVSLSLEGIPADQIIEALSGFAYSAGSACMSGSPNASHVLKAIGRSDALARATIRLGFGRFNANEEVSEVTARLLRLVREYQCTPSESPA